MVSLGLKNKEEQESALEALVRQIELQLLQITSQVEKLANLDEKVQKIDRKVAELEKIVASEGFMLKPQSKAVKTKEAIKLILQKYGELTAEQLSRLVKLSRTRSNEYLKEMEREGVVTSRVDRRKRYYKLRQ